MEKSEKINRVPIILVIGEFSLQSNKRFGRLAWEEIKKKFEQEYNEASGRNTVSALSYEYIGKTRQGILLDKLKERILSYVDSFKDSAYLPPYPIRFDDSLQFRKGEYFKLSLFRILTEFNVLAIVSCSPAENTIDLFKALYPLEIPVFITVSSIANPLTGKRLPVKRSINSEHNNNSSLRMDLSLKNILRLIPNNDMQAQAILERIFAFDLTSAERQNKNSIDFIIYAPEKDDIYVRDLSEAISGQSEKRSRDVHPILRHDLEGINTSNFQDQVIISVGYKRTLDKLVNEIKRLNFIKMKIIQTDGCTIDQAEEIQKNNMQTIELFLSRPAILHQTYAQQVYATMCKIWSEQLFPKFYSKKTDLNHIQKRLEILSNLVAVEIETDYPYLYYFIGNENQKGGYHIEKISN